MILASERFKKAVSFSINMANEANADRKYGVVIADNNYGMMKMFLETLERGGAKVKELQTRTDVLRWDKSADLSRRSEDIKDLVEIADDIELHILYDKKSAARYVGRNADSLDLVIMNRSRIHSPDDMDGAEAIRHMRKEDYGGWIMVQSTFLTQEMAGEVKAAGANDVRQKGLASEVVSYIVNRYKQDRA